MFKMVSAEKRQEWKEKIQQQKSSGLPIKLWCKENKMTIGQFYYWKNQFFPEPVSRSSFSELKNPKDLGVRIECGGIQICLDPHFDPLTLKKCLAILREITC